MTKSRNVWNRGSRMLAVLGVLKEHPGLTSRQIAEKLGCSKATVDFSVRRLYKISAVRRVEKRPRRGMHSWVTWFFVTEDVPVAKRKTPSRNP